MIGVPNSLPEYASYTALCFCLPMKFSRLSESLFPMSLNATRRTFPEILVVRDKVCSLGLPTERSRRVDVSDNRRVKSDFPLPRGDSPIIVALQRDLPKLALELLDQGLAAIPEVAGLPPYHFVDETVPAMISGLTAALDALEKGRRLERAEFEPFLEPVIERHMHDGIPPQALVRGLGAVISHLWDTARSTAGVADLDDFGTVGSELLRAFMEICASSPRCTATSKGHTNPWPVHPVGRCVRRWFAAPESKRRRPGQEFLSPPSICWSTPHVGARLSASQVSDALVARKRMRLVQRHFDHLTGS